MTAALSRRSILKALGLAPAAAGMMAQGLQAQASTAMLSNVVRAGCGSAPQPGSGNKEFFNFMDWWRSYGEKDARRSARQFAGFDAEIMCLKLPLATKVRMQTERNYRRIKAERQADFLETVMAKGKFTWWA